MARRAGLKAHRHNPNPSGGLRPARYHGYRMLRFLALALLLPAVAAADDWVEFKSGPFEVWTNAGNREAREVLNHLEQVRYVVGTALGNPELTTTWPIRVLVMKKAVPFAPALARDTYTAALPSNAPIPREWVHRLVRLLIEDGARRMPPEIESGLAAFYSTMQVEGTRITLGAPVPPAERDEAWARIHLLQTTPEYSGKIRVLLYNLQHGVDPGPAYRNAFGKDPGEIEKQAAAYLAAGKFGTWPGNSKPISAQRDFRPSYEAPPAAVGLADLKLVAHATDAAAAYEALLKTAPAVANEGLGLLATAPEGRRKYLAAAVEAGTKSARAYAEYARIVESPVKRREALAEAARLNPRWAEPHILRASLETDPLRKLQALQAAAKLAPRDSGVWRSLAEQYMALDKYADAARAWTAAANAATNDAERQSIRAARQSIEDKRLEWQAAERRRIQEEREREMKQLRDKSLSEVRAAEARANAAAPPPPPDRVIVPMFEGGAPQGRVRGNIIRIECMPPMARFTVRTEAGTVRLLGRDPAKILVSGGEARFDCGPVDPPRLAVIEFFPKMDEKTGTTGEVAAIDYIAAPIASPDAGPTRERKKLGDK